MQKLILASLVLTLMSCSSRILITFILGFSCQNKYIKQRNVNYSVQIWNINSSRAFVNLYSINNDSVSIKFLRGVVGDSERVLFKKALSMDDKLSICNYFGSIDIDTLQKEYINGAIEDGDQKRIQIIFGQKTKTIDISNFYQKDLGALFNVVNAIVGDKKYKIKYQKPVTQGL